MTRPSGQRASRRIVSQDQRRLVRVLSEGEVTERGYLREWVRRTRPKVRLDLSHSGMTPDALVRRAREHVQRNRRTRRADRDFDEIWCVFDTDEHENLPHAIEEARQGEVRVAVSNPCFELWLVLHVQEQTAHIHRHSVQHLSNELGLTDGKRIDDTAWDTLIAGFETAKQRAQRLDERHEGNGSPPRSNPSSDVWRLVNRLRDPP